MKNSLNLGFIVLILAVLGCSCPKLNELANKDNSSSPTPVASPTTASSTPTPRTSPSSPGKVALLTKEKADQIKTGMSKSDVIALLGEGEVVSTTKGGGLTFVVMKWTDEKYNYIIMTFKNDKVTTYTNSVK